jgi:hypothetical protein
MAIVKVEFDDDDVPVVTGEEPDSEQKPIENAIDTGGVTNTPFLIGAGTFTFSLDTDVAFTPLWKTVQTIDGVTVTVKFNKVKVKVKAKKKRMA